MRRLTRRQQIAAILLTAVALLFISLDFAGGHLSGARGGATGALGSLYRGTDGVLGPVRRFVQGIPDVGRDRSEIARLQQQNLTLRRQLADQAADAETSRQLKALQLQSDSAGWTTMPARVLATGPGAGFEWTVTVDVGRRDGVSVGQSVTDGYGLVGRVVDVLPTTSVILLAADPTFGVGARDLRSGSLLLANGRAESGMSGSALQDKVDVRVGDRLSTGPAGQTTFVAGIEIGTVTRVTTSTDGSSVVAIRPTAPQTGLNLVGIVLAHSRTSARASIGTGQ